MVDDLFNEFTRRGLKAEIINGALRLLPTDRIDSDLREAIKGRMPDILAHIASNGNASIEWRLKAFLIQLQPLAPPTVLPFLAARECEGNGCKSCGDSGGGLVCGPCSTAKRLALDLWMARTAKIENAA